MKKIMLILMSLLLIGCGGSNGNKYRVTDDGNGTHSPRILKVLVTEYTDGNVSDEVSILYSYNKENMLVENKSNTYNISYKYNSMKQIISIYDQFLPMPGYEKTQFTYSEVLYVKTKQPIITSSQYYHGFYDNNGQPRPPIESQEPTQIDYDYTYNDKGVATRLNSVQYIYTVGPSDNSIQYIYDENGRVIQEDFGDRIQKQYTYNTFGKLSVETIYHYSRISQHIITKIEYFYNNKHLLTSSKEYDISKTTGDEKLERTTKYSYENKPYYLNPSPNHLDQGQYSSSGIY